MGPRNSSPSPKPVPFPKARAILNGSINRKMRLTSGTISYKNIQPLPHAILKVM